MSAKEKQKQLKELLRNIYKKNELLIKQQVSKGNPHIATPEAFGDQSARKTKQSSQSSGNKQQPYKRSKYSEEKWVDLRD
jgi:dTDP-D-glucose 4,6-dehydratase